MFLEQLSSADIDLARERVQQVQRGEVYALPNKTELDIWKVFDDLTELERGLVAPTRFSESYISGTASAPDEILMTLGDLGVMVTTEHATAHWLPSAPGYDYRHLKGFEAGTAAIGGLLARDVGSSHATLRGLQTGNANQDTQHPFKDRLRRLIYDGQISTLVSLHGMGAGLVHELSDERSFDVMIGVGDNPSVESIRLARLMETVASALGLRTGINQEFLHIETLRGQKYLVMDDDGNAARRVFKAPEQTVRGSAQTAAENWGVPLEVIQVELSMGLRVLPIDRVSKRYPPIGPTLGYLTILYGLGLADYPGSSNRGENVV